MSSIHDNPEKEIKALKSEVAEVRKKSEELLSANVELRKNLETAEKRVGELEAIARDLAEGAGDLVDESLDLLENSSALTARDIAVVCYEVNKAYCESQKDFSFNPWRNAPDWQKDTVINGVNYHLLHPASGPANSHSNWLEEKARDGWIYGEVKDPKRKTHPCFVPFNELPVAQQAKDFIFLSIVRNLEPLLDQTACDPGYDEAIDSQDGAEGVVDEATEAVEQSDAEETAGAEQTETIRDEESDAMGEDEII